jgi:uncharacterized repeat protein (TIGR01451 family)
MTAKTSLSLRTGMGLLILLALLAVAWGPLRPMGLLAAPAVVATDVARVRVLPPTSTPTPTATPTVVASLMVAKWVDKRQALVGEVLQYTLVVMNDMLGGDDPGSYVQLVDPLPDTLELVPGSLSPHASYDADTRTILWSGQVPRGGSIGVTFHALLTPAAGSMRSVSNTMVVTDAFGRELEASAQTHIIHPTGTATPTSTAEPPPMEHRLYLPVVFQNTW